VTAYENSAARQAAALRARARGGLWRRLRALLGFGGADASTEAVAARWDIGAAAEAQTAAMLRDLDGRGWHILHDRALPGSRANLDHVLVAPNAAAVVVLDTKRWHAQRPTTLVGGRVHCGDQDRHGQIEAVASYARRAARALGIPAGAVWPLLVVHGSRVSAPGLPAGRLEARADDWSGVVHVLNPEYLVPTLAAAPVGGDRRAAAALAAHVAAVLPPYRG
jgi:hypothetical protein